MERMSAVQVLQRTLDLLRERGWTASPNGGAAPFGPTEGPLKLNQALWRAASDGTHCDPLATGQAAKALCLVLKGDLRLRFCTIGQWCEVPGRTQAEVEELLGSTIEALRAGARTFAAQLDAMLAEDGGDAETETER